MEKYDIYKDISVRTGGDIYIGVVGPVRTGKSTFITKFMENAVMPNISNKLQKKIATDEMPQSAEGKTIMTTQPKFVPANAVKVTLKNKATANVRLVDCVGYLVEDASGYEEDGKPRLVKTPWSEDSIPFEKAAEIGTEKVIKDYSTIGIVVTTDGSFTDIPRESYVSAEERVINELTELKKPFIIILNTVSPESEKTQRLAVELEQKYGVSVINKNVSTLNLDDIGEIMEKVLLEFPMCSMNVEIPNWMRALPPDNRVIKALISKIKDSSTSLSKMRDFSQMNAVFCEEDDFDCLNLTELKFDKGEACYEVKAKDGLFYKVLSEESGEEIKDEFQLLTKLKEFSVANREYSKIKDAMAGAETLGYGVVVPNLSELELGKPSLVKKGGNYGVKLRATAPSYHIVKVDVSAEVSPLVGSEKQGEELVNFLMEKYEENPEEMWNTNVFGKSLKDLVTDGLSGKVNGVPDDVKGKLRKTLSRIVNENHGGIICILL